jgi:predicted MFS family arabinose efflux permease
MNGESATDVTGSNRQRFLVNRHFTLLLVGQGTTNIAVTLYTTLMLVWVYELTNSGRAITGVLIASALPACVLGPIAGVFVDRWDRRHIMLACTGILALAAILPFFAAGPTRLPAIYGSMLVVSLCTSFFMPAKSGVLQVIVPRPRFDHAAYLSTSLYTVGFVCGPAISAPLYFTVGPAVACLTVSGIFLLSAMALAFLPGAGGEGPRPEGAGEEDRHQDVRSVWQDLVQGARFVIRTRVVLVLLMSLCLVEFASSAFNALNLVFITRRLDVGAPLLGPINTAIGVGTLIGSVVVGGLATWIKPDRLFSVGILLVGAGIVIYSLQTRYLVAVAVVGIAVVPQGGLNMGLGPLLIGATPRSMIGRTQSVVETAMQVAILLSLVLAGYVVQVLPITAIVAASGAIAMFAGLIGWVGLIGTPTRKRTGVDASLRGARRSDPESIRP